MRWLSLLDLPNKIRLAFTDKARGKLFNLMLKYIYMYTQAFNP